MELATHDGLPGWRRAIWHGLRAALLGLMACDAGGATELADDGADGAPVDRCDALHNAALERGIAQRSVDGTYSRERLLEMSELFVHGESSLDGIECLPHLKKLWLEDGRLQDFSALSALTELEHRSG